MTCEQCIHYDICNEQADGNIVELMGNPCFRFMDKDSFVEVGKCGGCAWANRKRPQKCSCCRRNPDMKDCYEVSK